MENFEPPLQKLPFIKEEQKNYMTAEKIAGELKEEIDKSKGDSGKADRIISNFIRDKVKVDGETVKERVEKKRQLKKEVMKFFGLEVSEETIKIESDLPAQESKPAASVAIKEEKAKLKKISTKIAISKEAYRKDWILPKED